MGLNEFAGYIAVAIVAFISSWIASEHGFRPYPFYIGIAFIFLGLVFSVLFIKETSQPYYNLAASKFYEDREGFYWIAFNSTERNKIAEDDYLIIKKSVGRDVAAESHGKFKVLDISNEFPNFLQHEEKIRFNGRRKKTNKK